jgi:type I restriction enzyme M protein
LAARSLSSEAPGEVEVRRSLVDGDLLDCVVALPQVLYAPDEEPACLWFVAREKRVPNGRDRRGEVLFIDARRLGGRATRWSRELSGHHVNLIADLYRTWRGEAGVSRYRDVAGLCRRVGLEEIQAGGYRLDPAHFVGQATAREEANRDNESATVRDLIDLEALDLWQSR